METIIRNYEVDMDIKERARAVAKSKAGLLTLYIRSANGTQEKVRIEDEMKRLARQVVAMHEALEKIDAYTMNDAPNYGVLVELMRNTSRQALKQAEEV